MNPITEKMTNPENMLVPLLMHEMMNASLTFYDNQPQSLNQDEFYPSSAFHYHR